MTDFKDPPVGILPPGSSSQAGSSDTANIRSDRASSRWAHAAFLIPLLLSILGAVSTWLYREQEDKNRQNQLELQLARDTYQLIAQREQFELDFKAKNFQMLLDKLINSKAPVRERITILRLFYKNFPERFDPRVFFDVFYEEASRSHDYAAVGDLRSLANEITQSEVRLIEASAKREYATISISAGQTILDTIPPTDSHGHNHFVEITLIGAGSESVTLKTRFLEGSKRENGPFEVSFFDTPFTDFTLLPDGHRMSIVLESIELLARPSQAKIKLVEFGAHYFISGDRPREDEIGEMVVELMRSMDEASKGGHTHEHDHEHEH